MASSAANSLAQLAPTAVVGPSRRTEEEEYARLIAIIIRYSPNTFAAHDMGEEFAEDSAFAFFHQFPNILNRYLFGFFEYRIHKFEVSVHVLHPENVTTQEAYFRYMDNYLAFFTGMRIRTEELLKERS